MCKKINLSYFTKGLRLFKRYLRKYRNIKAVLNYCFPSCSCVQHYYELLRNFL